jgi:Undecaprenyl-phosphate glucose phosphotransferase
MTIAASSRKKRLFYVPVRLQKSISPAIVSGFVAIADGFVILAVGGVSYIYYVEQVLDLRQFDMYSTPAITACMLMLGLASYVGLYRFDWLVNVYQQIGRLVFAWSLAVFITLFFGFQLHVVDQYSRAWALIWMTGTPIAMIVSRALISQIIRRWIAAGLLTRNAVVVGSQGEAERLLLHLKQRDGQDYRICGVFAVETPGQRESISTNATVAGYPVIGSVGDLPDFVRTSQVDDVFVALPWDVDDRINEILSKLRMLPVDVRLVCNALAFCQQKLTASRFGEVTVLEVARRPLRDWDALTKRAVDVAIAGTVLLFLLPPVAIVALAIKFDSPGPVIFRQKRFGFNNSVIEVFKFRTMYAELSDPTGARRTIRGDSRVTRLGALLRRSSIDELPQLFNVLRGDMSIVGPRAHPIAMLAGEELYHTAVAEYIARHRVRPGLTGWAQVNGLRGEIDSMEKARRRVDYDLFYIENWSIWFDIRILIRTVIILFKEAY